MSNDKNTRHAADFGEYQRDGREGEAERSFIPSHNEDDTRSKASAKRTMSKAVHLRLYYPETWASIEAHALDLASKGQRVPMQYALECARAKDFIDPHGNSLHITNDCAAVFARWLIAEHPALAEHITTRPSVFDGLAVPCDPETGKPIYRYFATLAALYG